MKHVHLIGIGGTGLSAIALVLLERGVEVSGSDRQLSALARQIEQAGARVMVGHRAENVRGADLVVRSSAVMDDNVEVQAARQAGIPVLKRADFLNELMAGQRGIAVAGTHGKTTTTAMLAWVLASLERDPSYIIGGVAANLGTNAHSGAGPEFVIEADEYDFMFHGLRPQIAVVTNVEHDHPDCFPTSEDFFAAFQVFAGRIQPGGALLACCDDPGAARLLAETAKLDIRRLAYGLSEAGLPCELPGYRAIRLQPSDLGGFAFEAHLPDGRIVAVALQVPGQHNVRNALAALAVADLLGLNLDQAAAALAAFRGTGRRFELRGEAAGVTVIDDYAHHPTEIRATLAAARARFPGRRIWAVWQPHTYSRTRTLFADFVRAFADADAVVVTEVFAAREPAPADGFSARQVVEAMQLAHSGVPQPEPYFAPDLASAARLLLDHLRPGDVVLVLSAGDADRLSGQLLDVLRGDLPSQG